MSKPGQAQGVFKAEHGEWEVTALVGGSFLGSSENSTPVEGSSESRTVGLKYDAGLQVGGGVAANLWDHWGAALEYRYSFQPLTVTNLSDDMPTVKVDHAVHRLAYDILYYPFDRDSRLRPYVFGGPGLVLFHVSSSGKDAAAAQGIQLTDPWKLAMNWGGGVKYLLIKQVAAGVHFSDSISGIPGYGLPTAGRMVDGIYVPGFRPDGLLHNWQISGRLMIQWDEK